MYCLDYTISVFVKLAVIEEQQKNPITTGESKLLDAGACLDRRLQLVQT